MNNYNENPLKLYEAHLLCQELFIQYPESVDKVLSFLIDLKESYKKTQKSIEQEYVVFEEE